MKEIPEDRHAKYIHISTIEAQQIEIDNLWGAIWRWRSACLGLGLAILINNYIF